MKYTEQDLERVINKLAQSTRTPRELFSAHKNIKKLEKMIARKRMRRLLYISSTAAAIILLCIFSWSIYNYMEPANISTISTLAETKMIQLPDGTSVTLNHYSSISFPEKFKNKNREVELSGEAYFDVTKDKEHPFIVQTGSIHVEVLGTQFNIEAYQKDEIVKTSLFGGSVAVNLNQERLILVPNETAIYNKSEEKLSKIESPNILDDIAWRNGSFVFSNIPLKEISRELSNSFGVDIRIEDIELREYKMTARFTHKETLEEILSLLQSVGNFKCTKNDQTIIISK